MMTHTSIHIHMRSTRKAPCLPIMSNRNLGMLGLSQLYFAKLWLSQLDFAKLCGHYPVMKISVASHSPCCTASMIFAHSSARHSNIVPARVSTNLAASAQQCSPIIPWWARVASKLPLSTETINAVAPSPPPNSTNKCKQNVVRSVSSGCSGTRAKRSTSVHSKPALSESSETRVCTSTCRSKPNTVRIGWLPGNVGCLAICAFHGDSSHH